MLKMSIYLVVCVIIGASIVIARPVDVNNDDRPLIDYISPNEVDTLPIVEKERSVNLEYEGIPSKGLSIYDGSQQKFGNIFRSNAEPIVDNIKEEEKYGNDGDRPFDRAVVNTLERLSNFVNTVIETPRKLEKSFLQSVTGTLDKVGARIVGL